MSNLKFEGEHRLRTVLTFDKSNNPDKIKSVVLSELLCVLAEYMDINKNNIDYDIVLNDKGGYTLKLCADVKHLHLANHIV